MKTMAVKRESMRQQSFKAATEGAVGATAGVPPPPPVTDITAGTATGPSAAGAVPHYNSAMGAVDMQHARH